MRSVFGAVFFGLSIFALALVAFPAPSVAQDDGESDTTAKDYGPWRPKTCLNIQAFGSIHWLDHSDVNNYIDKGGVEPFGVSDADPESYGDRATPVFGARLGMVFNSFVADLMGQYYKQWRDGPHTGATISGFHLLFHVGKDVIRTPFQLYPYAGIGWSYTNFIVNGDDRRKREFPDYSGAKTGVPGDVGLGFELQNPAWTSRDPNYRAAINLPVFLHIGYQGELITYFWQIKHGRLERAVLDRFMGPYVRVGVGIGKGTYVRQTE
ncbi:hypothetical protein K8I61_06135 [bacterium]|nr:hypothetical protein [bacterium]